MIQITLPRSPHFMVGIEAGMYRSAGYKLYLDILFGWRYLAIDVML